MRHDTDTKGALLALLERLRELTEDETEAIRDKDFVRVDTVQTEKATVRDAILKLEAPALEGKSRFADDPDVQEAVGRIMEMDQANNAQLSRDMGSLKQAVEEQTRTGNTMRRVHGAYGQRQLSANWQAVT